MTTKIAVIATVAIVLGAIVLGLVILSLGDPNTRNAGRLGENMALVCLFPLFIIWILWAGRFRKELERKQRLRASAGKDAEKAKRRP